MKQLLSKIAIYFFILSVAADQALAKDAPGPAGEVNVEVVSDTRGVLPGIPLREVLKNGTGVIKQYLEVHRKENYGIMVRNNTPGRIGVVIAVDGRNIIDGKRSDLGKNEAMYVINGFETARYDGWRTSRDKVHRFYFTGTADSYSAGTFSDTSALGVIAVAVYHEKERPRLKQKLLERAPASAPQAGLVPKSEKRAVADEAASTGFGDALYSPVVLVDFRPESRPFRKTLLKYEWRETLCKKGIVECGQEKNRLWDSDDYAPYPPGYPGS